MGVYWKIFWIIVIGVVIFWAGAAAVSKWFGFVITDTNVELTFVGMLATFVVISNYAQVVEAKREFKKDLNKYKGMLNKEFDRKVENIENKTIAMIAFSEARAIKDSNSQWAFYLFFRALHYALLVTPIDRGIKMCIKELKDLIRSKKVKPFRLYRQQKDEMIEDLDKVDSTIEESTENIRSFLELCKIIDDDTEDGKN